MQKIRLGERTVVRGERTRPYLIAEAGVNHEGEMENAIRLVKEAAAGGADAVKFQTYKAGKIASRHSPSYWDTREEPTENQYQLFSKYDAFGEDEFRELKQVADHAGITFLSTPFDPDAVEMLAPLVPFFKIASADLTNHPLLQQVAGHGKPMILSTGAATVPEIFEALDVVRAAGCDDVVLLHCVLNYPCDLPDAHLGMIEDMDRLFPDQIIGYSDHTRARDSMVSLPLAWSLGASVIETHFTFDKTLPGNDHYHALDQDDLRRLTDWFEQAEAAVGLSRKHYLPSEEKSREHARRSLIAARPIRKGETLSAADIAIKRPGSGIPPRFLDLVAGGEALVDLDEDDILQWDMVRLRRTGDEA